MLLRRTATVLAGLFVLFVLIAPSDFEKFTLRGVPAGAARRPHRRAWCWCCCPDRFRKPAAVVGGVALGLFTVVKIMDIGFDMVLYRPFDLVLDWPLLGARDRLRRRDVRPLRLCPGRRCSRSRWSSGSCSWRRSRCCGSPPSQPDAVRSRSGRWRCSPSPVFRLRCLGFRSTPTPRPRRWCDHARRVQAGLNDQEVFAAEASVDAFRDHPGLLSSLQGKDVVFTFVESYGKSALDMPGRRARSCADGNSRLQGGRVLGSLRLPDLADRRRWQLDGAGDAAVRAVDRQPAALPQPRRERPPDAAAARSASRRGARSASMPGITQAWPEGDFFHYDEIYDAAGPRLQGPALRLRDDARPVHPGVVPARRALRRPTAR